MTMQQRLPIADYSHLEPIPDPPEREPDMQQHIRIHDFQVMLQLHFAYRDDVLICGSGYLRRITGGEPGDFAPDCVVAFGVRPQAITSRNGYIISEVGKPPELVLEVGSRSTGRRDYGVKRERYAEYGVREYWRFDPSGGEFHDAPIAGDLLVDGRYEPFPIHREAGGLLWGYSPTLGLELCWDDSQLRFRDPRTKTFLPGIEEERAIRWDAEDQAAEAEARTADAEGRAADAMARVADANVRAADAEGRAADAATRALDADARAADAEARAETERSLREEERQARLEAEERIRRLEAEIERRRGQ